MTILSRAWQLLVQNFWWRVLSLVAAVTIWVLVANEPELSLLATVPLEFRNMPDDLEMASPFTEKVSLELRGPSGELRGLGDGRTPAVVLDMSDVTPGVRTVSIGSGNVRLARGVRLVRAIPSEVRFEFDRRLVRTVPVKVRFTGDGDSGREVARYTVVPDRLVIVGPSRRVERVTSVLTDPVDVAPVRVPPEYHVNAFVDDSYVRFQSSPEVVVTVSLKKK